MISRLRSVLQANPLPCIIPVPFEKNSISCTTPLEEPFKTTSNVHLPFIGLEKIPIINHPTIKIATNPKTKTNIRFSWGILDNNFTRSIQFIKKDVLFFSIDNICDFAPQLSQNLAFFIIGVLHVSQIIFCVLVPQPSQNFAFSIN